MFWRVIGGGWLEFYFWDRIVCIYVLLSSWLGIKIDNISFLTKILTYFDKSVLAMLNWIFDVRILKVKSKQLQWTVSLFSYLEADLMRY